MRLVPCIEAATAAPTSPSSPVVVVLLGTDLPFVDHPLASRFLRAVLRGELAGQEAALLEVIADEC